LPAGPCEHTLVIFEVISHGFFRFDRVFKRSSIRSIPISNLTEADFSQASAAFVLVYVFL
jgi:hypothetical protein